MSRPLQSLPVNWRRYPSSRLERWADQLDEDSPLYDQLLCELDMRYSAEADDRIAQALGCG